MKEHHDETYGEFKMRAGTGVMPSSAWGGGMSKELKVGTLCKTINSKIAANNGNLVVIVEVNHSMVAANGEAVPYLIKRIDGQRHVCTCDLKTGKLLWLRGFTSWCAGYNLKRVDEGDDDASERMPLALKEAV